MPEIEEETSGAVDDSSLTREPGAGDTSATTAYCTKCHRRHRLAKWPEGHPRGDIEASTITGAGNADELAGQVKAQIDKKQRTRKPATERKLDAEEIKVRRVAAVRLGRKLAGAPFSVAVLMTTNPDWRNEVAESEITELAEDFADFAEAWGVHASGKIVAAASLAIGYAQVGGKVYARVKAKEAIDSLRP